MAAFAALVRKWSPSINLVARRDLTTLEERHLRDSAQLLPLAPAGAESWADLGSGGGFPGIVVAILAAEQRSALSVTLVESDRRKAAFLRTATRELGLDATVLSERAEAVTPLRADVVSARALAPLDQLIPVVARHLAPDGTALLPKGRGAAEEIDRARAMWSFEVEQFPSATDNEARLLRIERIARV